MELVLHQREMINHSAVLQRARIYAQSGQFPDMLAACKEAVDTHRNNTNVLLDTGVLLSNFGFLSSARECFERVQILSPNDSRAVMNLANLARDAGNHDESRLLYATLLERFPNHPMIRRNALVGLEYDPRVSNTERFAQAEEWGRWAVALTGGHRSRPLPHPLQNERPLRIGYVSADFCQHTVGLFVKDVLKAHDPLRVALFAYSAGQVNDWVTEAIRAICQFRDVARMDDVALARLIQQDKIDVLIDLSGHTAGSRLTVFAYRPASVQVSWLGYFATTGLKYLDAVLLDKWHAPPGTEAQFVEPVIHLPGGRFCYTPVPWMPTVSPMPVLSHNYITFGSFNNTGKYNSGVFEVWARILNAVPDSRLILKWRTFNDVTLKQSVREVFAKHGICAERIELRGPSFHADLLEEYTGIDIALDPFPFTGGLTSCEALWMGVPVVTWPQSRVVSRQTFAFLSAIGLPELAAVDADDYVHIAVALANDLERLQIFRVTLRSRMKIATLCNTVEFARMLEDTLITLYCDIAQ